MIGAAIMQRRKTISTRGISVPSDLINADIVVKQNDEMSINRIAMFNYRMVYDISASVR